MSLHRSASDFIKSHFTAVISDLHLCEEEPHNKKYPLWKLFKTRRFFFDREFSDFLNFISDQAKSVARDMQVSSSVELVLNGDIFDFDSVTALPDKPVFHIGWLERRRGLFAQEEKSVYKIRRILNDHHEWIDALRRFIVDGNRVVFVFGNHDLELHFTSVQQEILQTLNLPSEHQYSVRFCNWFYISNQDTLIEHGNQYDPYCLCQDPINPLIVSHNQHEVRLPFGDLATRYMINGMGFFNPHADSNYIMSVPQYIRFFTRYIMRAQPLLILTWFWGACITLYQSIVDRMRPSICNPLTLEDRVQTIALNSNATPRMVRELREMFAHPAASYPLIIARELWLDRAFLVLVGFWGIFQMFTTINAIYSISLFWMFIPLTLFLPFFIFYMRSINSEVYTYKEPQESILSLTSQITSTNRIVYGHTHVIRHEWIGPVEHLNSGCWSPAFYDVECTRPIYKKTFVWLSPISLVQREAKLFEFKDGQALPIFAKKRPLKISRKRRLAKAIRLVKQ